MKHLTLSLICFLVALSTVNCVTRRMATITTDLPSNTYRVGYVDIDEIFNFTVTYTATATIELRASLVGSGTFVNMFVTNTTSSWYTNGNTSAFVGVYDFQVQTTSTAVVPYTISFLYRGTTTTYQGLTSSAFNKVPILVNLRGCLNATVESSLWANYTHFNYFYPSQFPVAHVNLGCVTINSASDNFTADLHETGQYLILLTSTQVGYQIADRITVNLMCYDSVCGDLIKEGAEVCDNGNTTGCINCAADPLYNCDGTNNTGLACPCGNALFYWKMNEMLCIINCSAITNANGLLTGTTNQCVCSAGFIFDPVAYTCYSNCSAIPNAIALVAGTLNQCTCSSGYYFDIGSQRCILNCTSIAKTAGYNLNRDVDRCVCKSNYLWDSASTSCKIDCSSLSNTAGTASSDTCTCNDGYTWSAEPMGCNSTSAGAAVIGLAVAFAVVGVVTIILIVVVCKIWKAKQSAIFEGSQDTVGIKA